MYLASRSPLHMMWSLLDVHMMHSCWLLRFSVPLPTVILSSSYHITTRWHYLLVIYAFCRHTHSWPTQNTQTSLEIGQRMLVVWLASCVVHSMSDPTSVDCGWLRCRRRFVYTVSLSLLHLPMSSSQAFVDLPRCFRVLFWHYVNDSFAETAPPVMFQ